MLRPFSRSLRNLIWAISAIAVSAVIVLTAFPSQALEARLNTTKPVLGDTIVVEVANVAGTVPNVSLDGKSYPAFPISNDRYRAFVPTTPLDKAGGKTIQVSDGNGQRQLPFQLQGRNFRTQRIWLPPGKDGDDLGTDYEFDLVDAFKTLVTPQKFWNGPFARPAKGSVTSEFGVLRYYNGVFADDYYHRGVDYGGGHGAPVTAPAAGRIALVGREVDGFEIHGNTIGIDHGQGVLSIMIHLSRIDVQEGQMVQAGQKIGAIGTTGSSTGPHLHWGLYVNGTAVDPVPWRYDGFE